MLRRSIILAGTLTALLLMAQPAKAQAAGTKLELAELAQERGGFILVNGVTLDFGAVVRSYVGGTLVVETRLTWTPEGPVTSVYRSDMPGAVPLNQGLGTALERGLDLSGLVAGADGLILSDANGVTALVHSLSNGGIQNLVFNAADGRDIHQDLQLTLTLPGFDAVQRGYSVDRLGHQIARDIDLGMVQSLR